MSDTDIAKTALPKFIEKLEVCRNLFHGFNYSAFMTTESDLVRAQTITGGGNFLSSLEDQKVTTVKKSYDWPDSMAAESSKGYAETTGRKDLFIKESMLLRQALSLCRSLLNEEQRFEAAYFEAVRTLLTRFTGEGKLPLSLKK